MPLVTVLKERNLLTQFGNAKRLDLSVSTANLKFVQMELHVCVTWREVKRDIQGVTGGTDQTSGECSLGQTIPI